MLNNGNKSKCGFIDDIVSYIYDEIDAADRTQFEDHLGGCSVCTEEFAAISNARVSVFEWRREEFADLRTPQIVIPYRRKSTDVEEIGTAGMFAAVRAWMSFVNFPVAPAAGLVLLIGLGFVIFRFPDSVEQPMASNIKSPVETFKTPDVATQVNPKQPEVSLERGTPMTVRTGREIRPITVAEHRRSNSKKQPNARNSIDRKIDRNIPAAPILSENYDESEDPSLRLSDLFADVEG